MRHSLFVKILAVTWLLMLMTFSLYLLIFNSGKQINGEGRDEQVRDLMRTVVLLFEHQELLDSYLASLLNNERLAYIELFDTTGAVVQKSSIKVGTNADLRPTMELSRRTHRVGGSEYTEFSAALYESDQHLGYAICGFPIQKPAGDLWPTRIFALLLIMGLGLLFSLLVRQLLSRPARQVLVGAKRMVDGDLEHRIGIFSPDEIGKLAHHLNLIADMLKEARTSKNNMQAVFRAMNHAMVIT